MPPPADDVTTELSAPLTATSDKCPNCGSRMALDQRYCLTCGERRSGGGLREALPSARTTAVAAAPAHRPRLSPSSSLIAGIATLLLAMGVGVLIGRTGDNSGKSGNAPVQVVTVPAGGAGAATAAAAGAVSATTKSSKKTKASTKASTAATDAQKTAARSGVKLPPPVVKVGQKCQRGAKGCTGGKFTGSFFGQ